MKWISKFRSQVVIAVLACIAGGAHAQADPIDRGFGEQGIVALPGVAGFDPSVSKVQAVPGGFVVVHLHRRGVFPNVAARRFVSRLDYDGRFDARFGTGGTVELPPLETNPGNEAYVTYAAIAQDSAGRLLLAARRNSPALFVVLRLTAQGSVDANFGSAGYATVPALSPSASPLCSGWIEIAAIAEGTDGKLTIFGTRANESLPLLPPYHCAFIARLDATGALDRSFGSGGVIETPVLGQARLGGGRVGGDGSVEAFGVTTQYSLQNLSTPLLWRALTLRFDRLGKPDATRPVQTSAALNETSSWTTVFAESNGILTSRYVPDPAGTRFVLQTFSPQGTADGDSAAGAPVTVPDASYWRAWRMSDGGLAYAAEPPGRPGEIRLCSWRYDRSSDFAATPPCALISHPGVTPTNGGYLLAPDDSVVMWGTRSTTHSDGTAGTQLVISRVQLAAPIVEFFNTNLNHYFMTTDGFEAALIDRGAAGPGWSRTGKSFYAGGAAPVCRFYGTPGIGPNSHFYTPDAAECAAVKTDPGWLYEGLGFYVIPAASGGRCRSGLAPVHRLYNNRAAQRDSNHRHVIDLGLVPAMQAQGWVYEGVAFCARG